MPSPWWGVPASSCRQMQLPCCRGALPGNRNPPASVTGLLTYFTLPASPYLLHPTCFTLPAFPLPAFPLPASPYLLPLTCLQLGDGKADPSPRPPPSPPLALAIGSTTSCWVNHELLVNHAYRSLLFLLCGLLLHKALLVPHADLVLEASGTSIVTGCGCWVVLLTQGMASVHAALSFLLSGSIFVSSAKRENFISGYFQK